LGRELHNVQASRGLSLLTLWCLDPKLLAKIVGKDRTIDQATRSEKRAASLGLHSFRHTNATAMDSLAIPQQIRKQRLGHSGNGVTENYTHTFTKDERVAAEKLGELFGTGWPEKQIGKTDFFPKSFPNATTACRGNTASRCDSMILVAGGWICSPASYWHSVTY
jgi:hypothetical protein